MTAVRAAVLETEHYRAHLVAKLRDLATEITRQADRVRCGLDYDTHTEAQRRIAVKEACDLLDAAMLALMRTTEDTPRPAEDTGHRPRGTNPTRNQHRAT